MNKRRRWFTEDVVGREPTCKALKEQRLGGKEEKKPGMIQPKETRPEERRMVHCKGSE